MYNCLKLPQNFGIYSESINFISNNASRYDVDDFNFNRDSPINPNALLEAQYYNRHDKISNHLKQHLTMLKLDDIFNYNENIDSVYELFDSSNDIKYLNVNINSFINYNNNSCHEETFICIDNSLICGVICVFCQKHCQITNNIVKTVIHARCLSNGVIPIDSVEWDYMGQNIIVNNATNRNYIAKTESNIKFNKDLKHKLSMQTIDTTFYSQGDGKQYCTMLGFSGANAKYPCWTCDVDRDTINSKTSPETLTFHMRTLQENLNNALKVKGEGCIESCGITHYPIFHLPQHKQGHTNLHTIQGLTANLMQCCDHQVGLVANQNRELIDEQHILSVKLKDAEFKYSHINSIYERHKYLSGCSDVVDIDDEDVNIWFDRRNEAILAYNEIMDSYNANEQLLMNNNIWYKWYQMKKDMNFKGNYFHKGMIDGHDAYCMIYKNHNIVKFMKEIINNREFADKLEIAFCYLKLIYHFSMSVSNIKITDFEILQLKKAIINFIDLYIQIMQQYRPVNGVGNKIHDLIHIYLLMEHLRINGGIFNETRVENANQSLIEVSKDYLRYKRYDRLARMVRKIHLKVLFNK